MYDLAEEEAQKIIENLSKRCVYFQDDGLPFFALVQRRWDIGNSKELRLVEEGDHLWWWIFDGEAQKSLRTDMTIDIFVQKNKTNPLSDLPRKMEYGTTKKCSEYTTQYLRKLKDRSIPKQFDVLKDFTPKRVKVLDSDGAKFLSVALEPLIVLRSRIDDRVLLSKFMYAVTLTRMGRNKGETVERATERLRNATRAGNVGSTEGQHAQLVIEGVAAKEISLTETIRVGEYFCFLADFDGGTDQPNSLRECLCGVGPAKVRIQNYSSKRVLYVERSKTWKRSAKVVEEILEQIIKEVINPKKFLSRKILNKLGRESVAASSEEDSCVTWAKEKLTMVNVNLPGPIMGKNIATFTSHFTYPDEYHEQNLPEGYDLI